MPFYQDSQTQALVFFQDEPDLPGNWERLFDPDGYHVRAWRSLDALWRSFFLAQTNLAETSAVSEECITAVEKKGK